VVGHELSDQWLAFVRSQLATKSRVFIFNLMAFINGSGPYTKRRGGKLCYH